MINEISLFRKESTKNLYHEKIAVLSIKSPFISLYLFGLIVGMAILISTAYLNY
jgi:hypothetical protein